MLHVIGWNVQEEREGMVWVGGRPGNEGERERERKREREREREVVVYTHSIANC